MKRKQKKRKKVKSTPYDHIRKPIPRSGYSFKERKRDMLEDEHRKEMDDY